MRRSEIRKYLIELIDKKEKGRKAGNLIIPSVRDTEVSQIEHEITEIEKRYDKLIQTDAQASTKKIYACSIAAFSYQSSDESPFMKKLNELERAYNKFKKPNLQFIMSYINEITFNQLEITIQRDKADKRFKNSQYPRAVNLSIKEEQIVLLKRVLLIHDLIKDIQALEDQLDDLEQQINLKETSTSEKRFALSQYQILAKKGLIGQTGLPLFLTFEEYLAAPKSLFFTKIESFRPDSEGFNCADGFSTSEPMQSLTQGEIIEVKLELLKCAIAYKTKQANTLELDAANVQARVDELIQITNTKFNP